LYLILQHSTRSENQLLHTVIKLVIYIQ